MTATEARQMSLVNGEVAANINLINGLIKTAASNGNFHTAVEIKHDTVPAVRDHFIAKGFEIRINCVCGRYTLWLAW